MQSTEETIAKNAVDANLFQLGSTNPKKISSPWMFFGGGQKNPFFSQKCFNNWKKKNDAECAEFFFLIDIKIVSSATQS